MQNDESIRRHFEAIGARAKVRLFGGRPGSSFASAFLRIDVLSDLRGRYFDIEVGSRAPEIVVLQVCPKERHLLLYSRGGDRFLCGHDERDWFVAAVPKRVSTVREAKQALMPAEVWEEARLLRYSATNNRRNPLFVRQGEWFFVPVDREFPEALIHRDEVLRRWNSRKPHVCEELYREGGQLLYIVGGRAYTNEEYKKKRGESRKFARARVEYRTGNPVVYVRGRVRHPDHATVRLDGWHRVYINGEPQIGSVAFVD